MHGEMYANTAAASYTSAEAITPLGPNASVPPSVELQPIHQRVEIAASTSIKAVSISSARTMKRFP
jgi:hypothetical protein